MSDMEKKVTMLQKGVEILSAHQADIREKIEDMILDKLGFNPALQEDTEDGEYVVYLHTDSYDDLSDAEIDQLESLGITEDGKDTTEAVKKMFDLEFKIVGDWEL